jgi:peptidoglycan/LPS O-acetylase OafA/YrhL
MHYRREVDGLRAVAVLPVILFHGGFDWFSGGYVGVDVFFVISGYLITSILLDDMAQGRFSIARFYERRARRILPALFFVLGVTSLAAWRWMLPSQLIDYAQSLVAVTLFYSNIHFWTEVGYFAPAAELDPLLHTWSLAVEEQFYIVFPILLFVLWRLGRRPALAAVVTLSIVSLALSEWGWRHAPTANFFLIPTRAWELGAGAICAFLLQGRPPRANAALSTLGLALIAVSIFAYDEATPFPSLYALAPVGGAALVILFAAPGAPVTRLLSTPLLVGVGLVSYSAYLWHQPIFAFARLLNLSEPSRAVMAALCLASLALAWLTWRFVERPFRRGPVPLLPRRASLFAASLAAGAAFLALGALGESTEGRLRQWRAADPERSRLYAMVEKAGAIQGVHFDDGGCRFNVEFVTGGVEDRILACAARHGPAIVVVGDSHGVDLFNGFYARLEAPHLLGVTSGGCRPGEPAPEYVEACPFEGFADFAARHPAAISRILYHQSGMHLLDAPKDPFARISENEPMPEGAYPTDRSSLDGLLAYLETLAAHARVTWIGPRLEPNIGLDYILRAGCDHDYRLRPGLSELFARLDGEIAAAVPAAITYVSLIEAVDLDMRADFMTCDQVYWRDADHWSAEGAARFVARLLDGPMAPLRLAGRADLP